MPVFKLGSSTITDVRVGSTRVKSVYLGSNLIWPTTNQWAFFDDFERTAWNANNTWQLTSSTGVTIAGASPARYLQKDNTNGSADIWTVDYFRCDPNLEVTCKLGPINDENQRAAILMGAPVADLIGALDVVYLEFSQKILLIGHYDGSTWTTLNTLAVQTWSVNDTITFKKVGSKFSVLRNGTEVGYATYGNLDSKRKGYSRVGLSVRRASNIFGTYYGPTFDDIKVSSR